MDLIRLSIAGVLLMSSSHALALFMPEGFKIGTDTTVSSDEGCGVIVIEQASTEY